MNIKNLKKDKCMLEISFGIDDFGGEAASMKAVLEGQGISEVDHLWGSITFVCPGQPTIKISDDFTMFALAALIDVPSNLKKQGTAHLGLIGMPVDYEFKRVVEFVHLTSSRGDKATFLESELIDALLQCAERFISFLEKLCITHGQYSYTLKTLKAHLALV